MTRTRRGGGTSASAGHDPVRTLSEVAAALGSTKRLREMLPIMMRIVTRAVAVRRATVLLAAHGREQTCAWSADGRRGARALVPRHATRVFTYLTGDADRAPPARPRQISLPLVAAGGQLLGVLHFEGRTTLSERDLVFLNAAVVELAALVAREREDRTRVAVLNRLENRLRDRDDLFHAVMHDLGNPLLAIELSTRVLLSRLPSEDPAARKSLEIIATSTQEMNALIADLLNATRPERALRRGAERAHLVRELVTAAVSALHPLARARSQRLVAEIGGPDDLAVDCDAHRLRQVFSNLIGNAIKYTPERGNILVRAGARGSQAWFSVTDTGPGIPPRDRSNIFQPFRRGTAPGRVRGFGLGLSIAKRIIETFGGRLSVRSRVGAGSTFSFTLPRAVRTGSA